jgi:O-antigen/teichoic acid export membrane protein
MTVLPLSVLANLVVARSLGPHGYGTIATYMAAYSLLLAILNGGISDATIQWGAAAYARGDRQQLVEIYRRCAGYHALIETPFSVILILTLLHGESIETRLIAAIASGLLVFFGTTVVTLTAISMNAQMAKLNLVLGVFLQFAVITAAVQTHAPGPTWTARLIFSMLGPIGAIAILPRDFRRATLHPRLPRGWPDGFASYSIRTLVAGLVAALVFSRSEIFILDAYHQTAAAGLFALAAGLAVQITAPIDAMLGPLIPAAASLLAASRERATGAILRGIRLSGVATAPLMVLAVPAIAVMTPLVYGHRFASAGALFVSLGTVSCLQSVLHPVTAFIAALRRPMLMLGINAGALAIDLLLVLALVPLLGATAAVIGNSTGQLVSLFASVWVLRRYLHLSARQALVALAPFLGVAGCTLLGSVAGLLLQREGVAIWLCVLTATGVSIVAGGVALRIAGEILPQADLDAIALSFPRGGRLVNAALRRRDGTRHT